MAFVKFKEFGKKGSAYISITNSKSFGFGGDFLKKYSLMEKEYVELLYDDIDKKIAFKFTNEKLDDNAFKLINQGGTDSKVTAAHSFFSKCLKNINLDSFETRYEPQQIQEPDFGTLYVIQLKRKNVENLNQ